MADKPDKSTKRTPYEVITAQVLEQMQSCKEPWQRPWARPGLTMPANASTGRQYSGMNVPALWGSADQRGYAQNRWATFNQWRESGASVRKGERGTPVIWFKMYEPKDGSRTGGACASKVGDRPAGDGKQCDEKEDNRIPIARLSYVFNAAQVDGARDAPAPEPLPLDQRYANAERILAESGATIRHGYTRAYYDPTADEIHLPDKAAFKSIGGATAEENYYSTAFHELTHWSGAAGRMDRQFGKRFGDAGYAQEELTAELGSAFLCVQSGVTPTAREDHAQYLKSWERVLQDDPKAFTRAASAAQKASDFILARGHEREHEKVQEPVKEARQPRDAGQDFTRSR